ncbi:MAG: hypothetical protein KAT32_02640 [Candidatus Moranbacteria bacterium]|nr:hypothetical protein [Candidatus Moranbacteria bacterium]
MEKENIKNLIIGVLIVYVLFGFFNKEKDKPSYDSSQLVTLYKISVMEGQGVVAFAKYNDSTGIFAKDYCEKLRKIYEEEDGINYICSDIQYDDYKIKLK